jgi:hypothetical protein
MAPSLGLFGISRVSNFEALVLQVWIKSMAGKKPGHERFVSLAERLQRRLHALRSGGMGAIPIG